MTTVAQKIIPGGQLLYAEKRGKGTIRSFSIFLKPPARQLHSFLLYRRYGKEAYQHAVHGSKARRPASPANPPAEIGIPARLRVPRRYNLSPEALEQRRAAARSPAKATAMLGNRNNWRHGMYAENFIGKMRPCLSTCPDYPCSLVDEGKTEPGKDCLDKVEVIQFYRAVHRAIQDKEYDEFNDLAALQIGNTIKVIDMLVEDLFRDGTVVKREKYDAKGHLVIEYVTHPSLLALPKLIADLGLTPAEFMITPRSIDKGNTERDATKSLAEIMSRVGKVFKKTSAEDE